jgi:hypothetical protein
MPQVDNVLRVDCSDTSKHSETINRDEAKQSEPTVARALFDCGKYRKCNIAERRKCETIFKQTTECGMPQACIARSKRGRSQSIGIVLQMACVFECKNDAPCGMPQQTQRKHTDQYTSGPIGGTNNNNNNKKHKNTHLDQTGEQQIISKKKKKNTSGTNANANMRACSFQKDLHRTRQFVAASLRRIADAHASMFKTLPTRPER